VRIVAATNRDLATEVNERRFRADLYHRLNVVLIQMPPLRDRGDDVLLLLDHFVGHYASKFGKASMSLSTETKEMLKRYEWPGNVRELSNLVERAVLLNQSGSLTSEDFPLSSRGAGPRLFEVVGSEVRVHFPETGVPLELVEKRVIEAALVATGWNVLRAAKLLRVGRGALRYKIQKYGLEQPATERRAA